MSIRPAQTQGDRNISGLNLREITRFVRRTPPPFFGGLIGSKQSEGSSINIVNQRMKFGPVEILGGLQRMKG